MAKHTLKILRCKHRKIFKVCLAILQHEKSDFIAHMFYFYIFEKEELQTRSEHNGPIKIQTYWAW